MLINTNTENSKHNVTVVVVLLFEGQSHTPPQQGLVH